MKPKLLSLGLVMLGSRANAATFRWFLAYGDQNLVDMARSSGNDPSATIGREIPSTRNLLVPTSGGVFNVTLGVTLVSGAANSYTFGPAINVAFDQGLQGVGVEHIEPDAFSFRKLTYGGSTYASSFNPQPPFPAYKSNGQVADGNNDGIQDTGHWEVGQPSVRAAPGAGISVRPIGLSAGLTGFSEFGTVFRKLPLNSPILFTGMLFKSQLSADEVYGAVGTETGLQPIIGGDVGLNACWMVSGHTYQTSKYVVQAVPEPGTLAALGMGAVALLRRRPPRS